MPSLKSELCVGVCLWSFWKERNPYSKSHPFLPSPLSLWEPHPNTNISYHQDVKSIWPWLEASTWKPLLFSLKYVLSILQHKDVRSTLTNLYKGDNSILGARSDPSWSKCLWDLWNLNVYEISTCTCAKCGAKDASSSQSLRTKQNIRQGCHNQQQAAPSCLDRNDTADVNFLRHYSPLDKNHQGRIAP